MPTCPEIPPLSWPDADQVEALQGLEALVGEVLADSEAGGEERPQPLAKRSFSGKLNLGFGSELHRRVAIAAVEASLSINSYLLSEVSRRAHL